MHLRPHEDPEHAVLFEGDEAYALVCLECRKRPLPAVRFETVCDACFAAFEQESCWESGSEGVWGAPSARIGADQVTLEHQDFAPITGVVAVAVSGDGWLCVGATGEVHRVGVAGTTSALPAVPFDCEQLGDQPAFVASPDGRFAAVAGASNGVLWAVETGEVLLALDRHDYHAEQTQFPLAFVGHVLIHSTAWNRLALFDADARQPLGSGGLLPHEPEPDELDYFHGRLHLSPAATRIADTGWVWAPVGIVRVWPMEKWLAGATSGSVARAGACLAQRDYFWDGPCCWLDEDHLAVWGFGNDDENLVDALSIFDARTGALSRFFGGVPRGTLFYDDHLFVVGHDGCSIWDVESGTRVGFEPEFRPQAYHAGLKRFIEVGERLRITKVGP